MESRNDGSSRLDVKLDAVVDQVSDQATIEVGRGGAKFLVVGRLGADLGRAAGAFLQRDAPNPLAAHFLKEIAVADRAGLPTRTLELLEHGKENQCDHQPYRNLRKPLIVHRDSISTEEATAGTVPVSTYGIYGRS